MMLKQRPLQGTAAKPQARRAPMAVRGRRAVRVEAAASPVAGEKYDYVIVGGGSAGSVLANKLTADGSKKVLVLEAGGNGDAWEIAVPAGLTRLFKHPILDWGLNSVMQPQLSAREIYLARGRALGGSSCTNATLYHRGTPSDYDAWGIEGWGSKDVLDWFIAAENYAQGPKAYHGVGGSMNVEQPRYQNVLHEEFFRAAEAVGLKANTDFNDWSRPQAGYGEFQVAQNRGERADMYRTYLKPVMNRPNLKVLTGARTTKVQTESSSAGPRARGVEFNSGGETFTAELAPEGEVLLTAGTVHSPHLLMLSGIGPAKTLAAHGIPVVAALEGVGANLQDHPACLYAAKAKPEFHELAVTSEIYDKNNNIKPSVILQYLFGRNGPLATTGCDHGAFVSTTGKGEPDLQLRFVPSCALDADAIKSYVIFGELKKAGKNWPSGITLQLLAVRPKSKGAIGLKSSNPLEAPAIDIRYFSDPEGADMATLKAGLRLSRKLAAAGPLAKYLENELFPGISATDDSALETYIKNSAHSGNALTGTCSMGAANGSDGSVVSAADLRVHGVSGLRVIDASVIPTIPGGQTGAPVVMIAERAAAMLNAKAATISGGLPRAKVPAMA